MATFPELEPNQRSYTMGRLPITVQEGWAGGAVRFRHGTTLAGHQLKLSYQHLTATQAALLRTHYRTQLGGYAPFALPSLVWAGQSSPTNLVPAVRQWRYASAPEETHLSGALVNVSVTLESVF